MQICILKAISNFCESKYGAVMDMFLKLDLNLAKVVALYPENIAGCLAVPSEEWIPLFGGPQPPHNTTNTTIHVLANTLALGSTCRCSTPINTDAWWLRTPPNATRHLPTSPHGSSVPHR